MIDHIQAARYLDQGSKKVTTAEMRRSTYPLPMTPTLFSSFLMDHIDMTVEMRRSTYHFR